MKSVGIDIGSSSIKVAILESGSNSYKVLDYFEVPLPTDPGQDHYVHRLDALRRISVHCQEQNQIVKFCLALRQEQVILRQLQFPFRQRQKILKSVAFELEDDIPFDQDDAVFDIKIQSYKDQSSQILAYVAANEYIESFLQLCHDCGIEPEIISCEGAAIANLIEKWYIAPPDYSLNKDTDPKIDDTNDNLASAESDKKLKNTKNNSEEETEAPMSIIHKYQEPELLIHIGHIKTVFVLYQANEVINMRSINFGGRNIIDNISKKYKLNYVESQKTLIEKGFILVSHDNANQDQITFSNTIANSIDDLCTEIKRNILSINPKMLGQIKAIHISGGLSRLRNINAYMTQQFHIACNTFEHFHRHPQILVSLPKTAESNSSIAMGLAIEGLRQAKNPAINFRKDKFALNNQNWQNFMYKWQPSLKALATSFVIILVFAFIKEWNAESLSNNVQAKLKSQAQKMGLKGRAATPTALKGLVRAKRSEIAARVELDVLKNLNSTLDITNEISKVVPSKAEIVMDVKNLKIEKENVEIHGWVLNSQEYTKLESQLKTLAISKSFKKIESKAEPMSGKTSFGFSFKAQRLTGNM